MNRNPGMKELSVEKRRLTNPEIERILWAVAKRESQRRKAVKEMRDLFEQEDDTIIE